ncbi:hypothetical protein Taro_055701, partial [Colocasia esculenta]|nr:hypothetical protein [Colocasia esculenta]
LPVIGGLFLLLFLSTERRGYLPCPQLFPGLPKSPRFGDEGTLILGFSVIDPNPEGDLMWWQCRQPPCLLRSEVYAEIVLYRYNSYMPLRYLQGLTPVQADPKIAN